MKSEYYLSEGLQTGGFRKHRATGKVQKKTQKKKDKDKQTKHQPQKKKKKNKET